MVETHLIDLAGGIGGLAALSFVLLIYVIYDVIISRDMILVEKLIWIVLATTTGFIGILLYLYLVKYRGEKISDHADLEAFQKHFSSDDVDRLERLSRLKDKGDLTEKEFEQKKSEILSDKAESSEINKP